MHLGVCLWVCKIFCVKLGVTIVAFVFKNLGYVNCLLFKIWLFLQGFEKPEVLLQIFLQVK